MPREEKKQGLKVIHSTPGGWDASQYHYAPELQREKPEGTGITKGMGEVRMHHQPTHKHPTTRGYDRLSAGRKAPDTWNIDPQGTKQTSTPGKKKVTPEDLKPDPKLDEALDKDLSKRNIKPRKPRTPKTKEQ